MNLNYILINDTFNGNLSLAKHSLKSLSFKTDSIKEKFFLDIKFFLGLYLIDHNVVDYPSNLKKRFLIYYNMVNYLNKNKIMFFARTNGNTTSLSKVFPCSEWLERESFDFFGIFYHEHPDLRRILTDYGFPSYALRKDFPVQGYFDLVYSISSKKIQFKEIEFQQSFRVFIKENPYNQNNIKNIKKK